MAGVPRFRERLLESGDRATALEQAREYRDLIGAAWVLVTDEDGILVGRTDYPEEFGRDLSNAPLVAAALAGEQSGGAWLDDLLGRMFIAVGTPLRESTAAPEGAVVAAYELDDSLARAIGAATGTDVVFFALDSLHRPVIVGSTVAPVGMDGMDEPLRDSVFVAALTTDTLGAPIEVEANGAHLIGRAGEILSPAGDLRGGFVVFRSRAAELGAFRALRRTLLLAVIPGIGLALAFAFLMERQIAGV
jgi:hypothetical protein